MKENALLGWNTSTSVEIPYSSLTFKSNITERPREVDTEVEVWAFSNSRIIGNGTRYTNVGMYETYTSFLLSKRRISSLFNRGKKYMFILNLDSLLPRMSESLQTSTALRVRGVERFSCVSFIGRVVIVNHPEDDSCCVYIYLLVSHRGNNERSILLIRMSK